MLRSSASSLVALFVLACAAPPIQILRANVVTLDRARARAEAVAVRGGVVLAVGTFAEVRAAAAAAGGRVELADLGNATLLPGLGDAHGHISSLGSKLANLDVSSAKSEAELVALVAAYARGRPAGTWLLGRGWDQTRFPGGAFPTHDALSRAVPEHPVVLKRVDGHASFVNARALAAARIDAKTADPAGGRILRDAAGAPSGVLVDKAMDLVKVPQPARAEQRSRLVAALAHVQKLGFTMIHDLGTDAMSLSILRELARAGELPVRVVVYKWAGNEAELDAALQDDADPAERPPPRGWRLLVRGVKLIADGAMGSRGAALSQPYADEPANKGHLLWKRDALERAIAAIDARGHQPAVHAIGDDAVRAVLAAYAKLRRRALAPRLEHAQLLPEDGVALVSAQVSRAGLVASMQPVHLASDQRWVKARLGDTRAERTYTWRTLAKTGATLAFGSDFPVEDPNPLFGLHAATTRGDLGGKPAGFGAGETLRPGEALRAFTRGVARAAGLAGFGRIVVGAPADFSVFDLDLSLQGAGAAAADILRARALFTYVDGKRIDRR